MGAEDSLHLPYAHYVNKKAPLFRAGLSLSGAVRLRVSLRILQVRVSLLAGLLGFQLRVGFRFQRLNSLAQAQRLGSGPTGTGGTFGRRLAGHIRLHTREADSEILTDVSRCNARTQVLESGTGLLRRHSCQLLDLARERSVLAQLLIYGRFMGRT